MSDNASNTGFCRVQEIFGQAIELPPDERGAFVREACGDDVELQSEVRSLLEHDTHADDEFLRPPEAPDDVRRPRMVDEVEHLIGKQVGHYRIERLIAPGGMGTVFEALQDRPRRIVAVKVMRRSIGSRSMMQRFHNESQVLGRLRHPNIAPVYEAGVHEDELGHWPYFAMEFVAGAASIVEYAERKKLGTRDRLRLFAKVCDAAHHGHQKGVIHRDFKPSNILVNADGEPKVIDFGVARATDEDAALATQHTTTGQLVGTIRYMSPEQCGDDPHDIDTQSDVYSLGVVLYELLTGQSPYEISGMSIFKAARAIRETPPRLLTTFDRRLRGDVQTIVLKALEKDRERRYQSAAELAADISRYLNRDPIEARPPTAWTRVIRWVARHPLVATSTACVTVGTLIICATLVVVWFVNERPFTIRVTEDRSEAWLEARSESMLHEWKTAKPEGIKFAKLFPRPDKFGGGQLAVLGFGRATRLSFGSALYAFDANGDLNTPLWERRIEKDDIPPNLLALGRGPEFSRFTWGIAADIFPDPDHPGDEIVAVHNHGAFSQCAIRVYDLAGHVLYQVWHDGALAPCQWLPNEQLLVFAGRNSEADWNARGFKETNGEHPIVVFAIQPTAGLRSREFLRTSSGDDPLSPRWYQCLLPPRSANELDHYCLEPVAHTLSGGQVRLRLVADMELDAAVSWRLDADGKRIPQSAVVNDAYTANRANLPDPNAFHLGPLPPIIQPGGGKNDVHLPDTP